MTSTQAHHHRSNRKSSHKSFKGHRGHASKNELRNRFKGKVEDEPKGSSLKRAPMKKLDRRNLAKQVQNNKREEILRNNRLFDGNKGAPKIVAVVPLCEDIDSEAVVKNLATSSGIELGEIGEGIHFVDAQRFKQKLQFIVPPRDLLSLVDVCKVADFVIFVLSATQQVDDLGDSCLRIIHSQGVSNTLSVVQNLICHESIKQRSEIKKSLLSFMQHFFPDEEKVHAIDVPQEALNVIRALCTQHPRGVNWRDARSYMLVDDVRWSEDGHLVLDGVVRGQGLNADRLVHLQGFGEYQIQKILSYADVPTAKAHNDSMDIDIGSKAMDAADILAIPSAEIDNLSEFMGENYLDVAHEDVMEAPRKVVRLDDFHFFDEEDGVVDKAKAKKELPVGTSDYQAAWILDTDSDVDVEDDGDEMATESVRDDDPETERRSNTVTETVTDQNEMFVDLSPGEEEQQLEAFRRSRKEYQDDLEFPDEVNFSSLLQARDRFRKYRGMKSFRTSPWDSEEIDLNTPEFWKRLTRLENYKATKNRMLKRASVGGIKPGTRVQVYISNGPQEAIDLYSQRRSLAIYSLLEHEHKLAVLNFVITPSVNSTETIRSKDNLVLQCGSRRWAVQPLFSQHGASGTKNNVRKFERYMHPGRTTVATIVGPLIFGNIPALLFKESPTGLQLVGTGSFMNADHSRVIVKRSIITGHPFKIHKRLVTVRFMFFNPDDVEYFKPIPLFTKYGRTGHIKESLGTHGYFKATFDSPIQQVDTIGLNLYKRLYPRVAQKYTVC
ncbi:Ribosome biogenesis protein tsr1 [Neolecta irregularis DAH-3]|uniref:Ribosome biogenesis protein tsr1 n=1 Tax=Neolecta irregularis (strain DAH-3) TaxID=1198029 RepID=A0A1U7LT78_NEOID|nr:Ribosome biogenesis protein tsr1 [Neolecta irregularis DAH-3]|eukprot:OLL25721.1 Ribosome biogenesis protein tsr1 [Neolecta irregularis DAH-3]